MESVNTAADRLVALLKDNNCYRARLSRKVVCEAFRTARFPMAVYRDLQVAMELRGYMFADCETGGFVTIEIECVLGARALTFGTPEEE